MASTGPTDSIPDQAAIWAVEAEHGTMTPESRADLADWLAADPRHRGAYIRARAWLRATEGAVMAAQATQQAASAPHPLSDNDNENAASGRDPANRDILRDQQQPVRRSLLRWSGRLAAGGTALAASLAVLLAIGMPLPDLFRSNDTGRDDRIQIVRLRDGSVARLSGDARIQVVLSDGVRNITLLSGEATFDVAKDKARPFVVRSGDVYAQATGTVYSVSRTSLTGGTVKVMEGSVLVWPRDERDQAVRLQAGGTVTLDPGPQSAPAAVPVHTAGAPPASMRRLSPPDMAQISLDNVTIAQAAQRFNRVNSTRIIIADAAIGEVRIIGHYKANDPEQFAQAAAIVAGGKVDHENGNLVIKMK